MPSARLSILDVGHGNCAVLVDERGVLVIDTGKGDGLRQFLHQEGIRAINLILLSHADMDHIGGLIHLIASQEVRIDRIVVNADALKGTDIWEDLRYELTSAQEAGILRFEVGLSRTQTTDFDQSGIHIEIVGPSSYLAGAGVGGQDRTGRSITSNSISAVIRLSNRGRPVGLFTGDLDEVGLDDLIAWKVEMTARILVFPHHGGGVGANDNIAFARKLCENVRPEVVVFSIGRGLYGTPRPEIVDAIHEGLPGAWIACTELSEHCSATLPGRQRRHMNPAFAQGREKHKCCAGTIVIHINEQEEIFPNRERHLAFIRANAPTALCQRGISL